MLFNSVQFGIFLTIVFILYWKVFNKTLKGQNLLLLVVSYFFYCCWDWRFLFLLLFSTFLDFFTGLMIYKSESKVQKKRWLILSVGINLGFLSFFKYFNFFIDSFEQLLGIFHIHGGFTALHIILPIGISFYTFHGLSYVFDIYNNKIQPTYKWIDYSVFVSFFPLLVAGPIERATHLLPQVEKPRVFTNAYAIDGLKQILWGLFKKIVVADSCANYANDIFNNSESYSGSSLLVGAFLFAFQIYGDFSGYTDIALGSARLFGFELLDNFKYPYFSRDLAEFWRRWHISLSSWFKDYLYFPLGGSKGGLWIKIRNTLIIFIVSGFWHGANWTFIAWGILNALFIMPSVFLGTNRNNMEIVAKGKLLPSFRELVNILITFWLTVLIWVFFRADSISHAFHYISGIFSTSLFIFPDVFPKKVFALILLFIIMEWLGRENKYAIQCLYTNWPRVLRWGVYYLLITLIFSFSGQDQQFIYFQF